MILVRSPLDVKPVPDVAVRGLSAELHQALKAAAERNHRSLNREIVARLEDSVVRPVADLGVLMRRIEVRKARGAGGLLDEATLNALKEEGRS
jgi:hypothetical protein